MAITEVKELEVQRQGRVNEGVTSYSRVFIVKSNTLAYGYEVMSASGIPQYRSTYPDDSYAYAVDYNYTTDPNSPYVYYVTVFYQSDTRIEPETLPWEEDPDVQIKTRYITVAPFSATLSSKYWQQFYSAASFNAQEATEYGSANLLPDKAITNSATEPYVPGLTKDVAVTQYIITRNELPSDWPHSSTSLEALIRDYNNTINEVDWNGFEARKVKLTIDPDVRYVLVNGVRTQYVQVTYLFEYNTGPFGWDTGIVDEGTMILNNDSPPVPKKMLDITAPVHLDGLGQRLASNATVQWRVYGTFDDADFSQLNISQWF